MPELLTMPEVAANIEEATLSSWPIAENQPYAARDVIVTVETAKAAVDVEADAAGVIIKRLVPEGAEVRVGDAIALIGQPGETVDDLDAALASLGVTGFDPNTAPTPPANTLTEAAPETPAAAPAPGQRVFASPLARRLLHVAGIALESVTGTGPGGRIVRRDVERAVALAGSATAPPAAPTDFAEVPHTRQRRAIARTLTESKQTIPHFYVRGTAQVDRLLALRAELNAQATAKVSVNDLIVKAVAHAHLLVPEVNVIWTDDAIRSFSRVDLAVAVATDGGLVTPVLRGVEQMSIRAVAAATHRYVEKAKSGRLQQSDLEGGASAITNLGMFGTEEFGAIINPPQSSILAVGAARPQPVVTKRGKVKPATVLTVTMSVDHRPIDGATAARWMSALIDLLEQPVRILA